MVVSDVPLTTTEGTAGLLGIITWLTGVINYLFLVDLLTKYIVCDQRRFYLWFYAKLLWAWRCFVPPHGMVTG